MSLIEPQPTLGELNYKSNLMIYQRNFMRRLSPHPFGSRSNVLAFKYRGFGCSNIEL